MNRRNMLKKTALATASIGLAPLSSIGNEVASKEIELKGNIKHSVCRWCYSEIPFKDFCKSVSEMGITSIDLTGPKEWGTMQEYGLTCAMGWGDYPPGIDLINFWGEEKNHEVLIQFYEDLIPLAQQYGIKNLICHSGNLFGRSTELVRHICQKGIAQVIKKFEESDIVLSMELFNNKVNHPDQACNSTEWGVTLCEMVGSSHFKLLYDIYHMQIQEGDVIATIRKYIDYISHFHTAGVPGRGFIGKDQELNYPAIMQAIVDTGYKGWVAQEFYIESTDEVKLDYLRKAIALCDV